MGGKILRMSAPRILLLQAREAGDPVILEEIGIFARNARVPQQNLTPHSLLAGPPSLEQASQYQALMIGGSGEYFVSRGNLPDFQGILDFLSEWIEAGRPAFASCFGFQLIVRALGGEITYMPEKMELGTYPLKLTQTGQADPLFSRLPATFSAQLGHKDQATKLPDGVTLLASSELAPYQAIRIPGKPIWATQFHPEVTREENLGRFKRYIEIYAAKADQEDLQTTLDRFQPAVETERLIPGFMEIVFSWPGTPASMLSESR